MCQTTPFSGRGSRNAAEDDPRHNILHLNTEGLTDNKISVIEQLGYKNKAFIIVLVLGTVSYIYEFYIICVTETWLKSSVLKNLRFPGFCSLYGFEPNCHGGGAFWPTFNVTFFCQHRLDLECTGTKVLWLEYRTSIAFSITYNYG